MLQLRFRKARGGVASHVPMAKLHCRTYAARAACVEARGPSVDKKLFTLLDLCVSSLRRGHANLLCIVPILTDDPRRESKELRWHAFKIKQNIPG